MVARGFTMASNKLYVLGRATSSSPAMVLNLDGYPDQALATRAINWQLKGQPDQWQWATCKRVGLDEFKPVDGGPAWPVERSPYTDEAWQRLLNEWA